MRLSNLIFLLAFPLLSFSQSFEGKIVFNNTYTIKSEQVTSEQFTQLMGSVQEYYIKGNRYRSDYNRLFVQMMLYSPDENRLYTSTAMSDTLYWVSGNENPNPVLDFEIKKNQREILGFRCDVLILTTQEGKETYYFAPELKVDPKDYKSHQYGHWAYVMGKTKSIPLRIESEGGDFGLISEAVSIEERKLEDSFFDIPNRPKKKSPDAASSNQKDYQFEYLDKHGLRLGFDITGVFEEEVSAVNIQEIFGFTERRTVAVFKDISLSEFIDKRDSIENVLILYTMQQAYAKSINLKELKITNLYVPEPVYEAMVKANKDLSRTKALDRD